MRPVLWHSHFWSSGPAAAQPYHSICCYSLRCNPSRKCCWIPDTIDFVKQVQRTAFFPLWKVEISRGNQVLPQLREKQKLDFWVTHLSGELFIRKMFSGSKQKSWSFNMPFSTTEALSSGIAKNRDCSCSKDLASNTRSFRRKLVLPKVYERLPVSRMNILSSNFPKGVWIVQPCLGKGIFHECLLRQSTAQCSLTLCIEDHWKMMLASNNSPL